VTIVTKHHFKGEALHRVGGNSRAKADFLQPLLKATYRYRLRESTDSADSATLRWARSGLSASLLTDGGSDRGTTVPAVSHVL
jgi:hypothetical protein